MDKSNEKGSNGERVSQRTADRLAGLLAPINLKPIVADSSAQTWKRYADSRLRQFASGR
jgi:hypothetical protein